jgi:hypothetical protein
MTRANRATQALARADEHRASIVAQFHLPNLPPDERPVKGPSEHRSSGRAYRPNE